MKLDAARFRGHQGGIFKGPCGDDVHAMLVVGYAETVKGTPSVINGATRASSTSSGESAPPAACAA
ncbi:hypothetical protein C2845_PM05G06520 [Panicum miliaceum]|uniref:Uncharacterized protein n=1 Tax=Panicum miliaceum TaxID=4540 RepID=A0A3L6SX29_PANMI|nr:hypothetical protein C2845_PM05G06520 [Panicum miliaceum]